MSAKTIKKHLCRLYALSILFLLLWLTESYAVLIMDEINAICIRGLNKTAFGCVVLSVVIWYTGRLIYKSLREDYYISVRFLTWWFLGLLCYWYFRYLSSHYTFWGFDVSGWHVAYLDILALPAIVLVIIAIRCLPKKKALTSDSGTFTDEPITDEDDDLFGYKDMVSYLKEDIEHTDVSDHAFSVGITGAWGTGKSSFLNLFEKAVEEDEKSRSIVVRFYPRSSNAVYNIQDDFFDIFRSTVSKYHTNVYQSIKRYERTLRLADSNGIISKLLTMWRTINAQSEKDSINKALKDINRRIFVIIEDLDRLTGKEIIEVLKLIDRNGDFCNVFYMSAYDKEYVNSVLKEELGHQAKSNFTDKYFNYELPLPVQKVWVVRDFINSYLQNNVLSKTQKPETVETLTNNGNRVSEILARSLGNIRHAKRFLNLFMSRYEYVKDDVNVGDFLLLSIIRYSSLAIYDAIVKCKLVKRGGILYGNTATMYLGEDFDDKIKEYEANDEIVSILKNLFPSKGDEQHVTSTFKRIRRSASFDIYFYDRYSYRIYDKDVAPIFETPSDDNALGLLESLLDSQFNWSTIEEYLCYRGNDWIDSPGKLRRFIKLTILAYHKTNSNINYDASFTKMFFASTAKDFVNNKAAKDLNEYSAILFSSLDEMIERCSLSIGLKLTGVLRDIKDNGTNMRGLILTSPQYVDLAFKSLQTYTERSDSSSWSPMYTVKLSLIYPIGENTLYDKARDYITEQLNSAPEKYADDMIQSSVSDSGYGKKLCLAFREIGDLQQVFNCWETEFPQWIEKLPSEDERFVFYALFEALKNNDNILVNALKDEYAPTDYAGFREAIEKNR